MNKENETRMTLRLPCDLYEWLKADASDNLRSLNSQVVAILEEYRQEINLEKDKQN